MDSNNNNSDHFCNFCDKTIKLKYEKKHLNTKSYRALSMSIFIRYCVKNPEFLQIEDVFKKHFDEYIKKFGFYFSICEWKLDYLDAIVRAKSEKKYNIHRYWALGRYLKTRIDYLNSQGYKLFHISEMNITFISDLRNMTYQHYLKQPKHMTERTLIKTISTKPELAKLYKHISHPIELRYDRLYHSEDEDDI